jgi:hypothetical protein
MARKSRQTVQKLRKEKDRQQKQQAKAAQRLEAKQRRANGTSEIGKTTRIGAVDDPGLGLDQA